MMRGRLVSGFMAVAVMAFAVCPVAGQTQYTCGRDDGRVAAEANAARSLIGDDPKDAYETLNTAANFFYGCAKAERAKRGETQDYWRYYQTTAMTQVSTGDAAAAQSARERGDLYSHSKEAWANYAAGQRTNAFNGFVAICKSPVPSSEMKRRAFANLTRLRTQIPGWQNAGIPPCN